MSKSGVSLHWFRKGLRLHDNRALLAGLEHATRTLLPIYVFDKWHLQQTNVGQVRFRFIVESLQALDVELRGRGVSTGLLVYIGEPTDVLPAVWRATNADAISFDDADENEPHSRAVDDVVKKLAKQDGLVLATVDSDHWLHSPSTYASALKGRPTPNSFTQLKKIFAQVGDVPAPLPSPSNLPFDADHLPVVESLNKGRVDIRNTEAAFPGRFCSSDGEATFPGGEHHGLDRLQAMVIKRPEWTRKFDKPTSSPAALQPSTTALSPYLTHGCVSVRSVWDAVRQSHDGREPPAVQTGLGGQLMFRELWYLLARETPGFGAMRTNPLCRQIEWDCSPELLAAWRGGRTGFPFIDAIMTQLRDEGWIHHLARHMVACFLTRGDLWQSWEAGAAVFDEFLVDADWSLNNANWMWLSCSAFFHQYFRCYSPVAFGKKFDKEGKYIRKYLPALKGFPNKYIYEPWTAPIAVQRQAGCIIGKDYPAPIITDHPATSKHNMNRMKDAFANNKNNNHNNNNNTSNDKKPKVAVGKRSASGASSSSSSSSKKQKTLNSFFKG